MVLVVVPTGNTTWAGLASLAKPFFGPPISLFVSPFILVFHSPFCVHVLISTFGVQACPVDPYLEWLGVAGKAYGHGHGSVRRRIPYYFVGWFFPGPARYTQLASFFGHLMKCRGGGRPRQWLSSAWATDFKINWAWAETTFSLAPQLQSQIILQHFYKQ